MTRLPVVLLAHEGGWDEGVAIGLPLLGVCVVAAFALHGWRAAGRTLGPLPPAVRRRRRVGGALLVTLLLLDVIAILGLGPERWVAVTRNLLFPGLGLLETNTALGLLFVALALLALTMWVRWGAVWMVAVVWLSGVAVALAVVAPSAPEVAMGAHGPAMQAALGSHEFAAVMLVMAAVARARNWLAGLPGIRSFVLWRRRSRPQGLEALACLPPVDRARAAGILAIAARLGAPVADPAAVRADLQAPDLLRRAKRVALVARWQVRSDPLRRDNAALRAALALWGSLSQAQAEDLRADARDQWTGVPASEPGWVRLLDGTLAAVALDELGEPEAAERWQIVLGSVFALRGGHRPSCAYAPLAVGGPWAPTWEHAAATALANVSGQPVEDWPSLRQRALGAAARGPARPDDERLIAAGRIHARLAGDATASRILDRPTLGADPLAAALDLVAAAVRAGAESRP